MLLLFACLSLGRKKEKNLRLKGRFLENKTDSINDFSVTTHMCVCVIERLSRIVILLKRIEF